MQYVCKECYTVFDDCCKFSLHLIKKHHIKPKAYYDTHLLQDGDGICLTCGKKTRFKSIRCGYKKFCSSACVSKNEDIKNKKIETCIKHYGVENPSYNEGVIEKIKKTTFKHYGVENAHQSDEIKNKIKNTCLQRYGVETYLGSERCKDALKEKMNILYGCDYPAQSIEVQEKMKKRV